MWDDGAKALGLARGRPRRLGRLERGGSSGTTSDDEDDDDASFFAPVIPIARLRVSFYASRTQKLTARVSLSLRASLRQAKPSTPASTRPRCSSPSSTWTRIARRFWRVRAAPVSSPRRRCKTSNKQKTTRLCLVGFDRVSAPGLGRSVGQGTNVVSRIRCASSF